MDKVSRLHFPSPFLYPLPIPIPGLAPPSSSLLPTPVAITTGVLIRSSRFGSFLFQIVSRHLGSPSAPSVHPTSSHIFRSTPPRFDDLVSARVHLGLRLVFATPVYVGTRCNTDSRNVTEQVDRIRARKSGIRNTLRTEMKPLEYGYKCCGIQFENTAHLRNLRRYSPIAATLERA